MTRRDAFKLPAASGQEAHAHIAKVLTLDKARRIAANIAGVA